MGNLDFSQVVEPILDAGPCDLLGLVIDPLSGRALGYDQLQKPADLHCDP